MKPMTINDFVKKYAHNYLSVIGNTVLSDFMQVLKEELIKYEMFVQSCGRIEADKWVDEYLKSE